MCKVYELPDEKVSPFWQHESGTIFRWALFKECWYDINKQFGGGCVPVKGRWMPWTPPTFPERKKVPRRCWAMYCGKRFMAIYFPSEDRPESTCFRTISGQWLSKETLTDIVWIDNEEYEDELPVHP